MSQMSQLKPQVGSVVDVPLNFCPACHHAIANTEDKFCRNCGMRILTHCVKCQKPVRYGFKWPQYAEIVTGSAGHTVMQGWAFRSYNLKPAKLGP